MISASPADRPAGPPAVAISSRPSPTGWKVESTPPGASPANRAGSTESSDGVWAGRMPLSLARIRPASSSERISPARVSACSISSSEPSSDGWSSPPAWAGASAASSAAMSASSSPAGRGFGRTPEAGAFSACSSAARIASTSSASPAADRSVSSCSKRRCSFSISLMSVLVSRRGNSASIPAMAARFSAALASARMPRHSVRRLQARLSSGCPAVSRRRSMTRSRSATPSSQDAASRTTSSSPMRIVQRSSGPAAVTVAGLPCRTS